MHPTVSIIVPNYNHQNFLKQRLDSIFNQTFQDFEVLIFDDASTDESLEVLEFYKEHPKVSSYIVNQHNSGSPFKQWRKGMELANGAYIWIAESDDFATNNFLEEQLKCIETSDVAIAKTLLVDNFLITSEQIIHPVFKFSNEAVLTNEMFFNSPIKNVSCVLFKKPSTFQLNSMIFDTYKIMGDQMFYFEYFRGKIFKLNENSTSYFRRVNSSVSNFNSTKGLIFFKYYFKEHKRFAKFLEKETNDRIGVKNYLKKHFNKVNNRSSLKQKFSFNYLQIVFSYQFY